MELLEKGRWSSNDVDFVRFCRKCRRVHTEEQPRKSFFGGLRCCRNTCDGSLTNKVIDGVVWELHRTVDGDLLLRLLEGTGSIIFICSMQGDTLPQGVKISWIADGMFVTDLATELVEGAIDLDAPSYWLRAGRAGGSEIRLPRQPVVVVMAAPDANCHEYVEIWGMQACLVSNMGPGRSWLQEGIRLSFWHSREFDDEARRAIHGRAGPPKVRPLKWKEPALEFFSDELELGDPCQGTCPGPLQRLLMAQRQANSDDTRIAFDGLKTMVSCLDELDTHGRLDEWADARTRLSWLT